MALMFVNGEGMSGGSVHRHIASGVFLGTRRTNDTYRFLSFADEFPGLQPDPLHGSNIAGELYEVSMSDLVNLVRSEPSELELSIVELEDAELAFGMVVRSGRAAADTITDITDFVSWRAYLGRKVE